MDRLISYKKYSINSYKHQNQRYSLFKRSNFSLMFYAFNGNKCMTLIPFFLSHYQSLRGEATLKVSYFTYT